jgi:hypothetical protein
VLDHETAAAVEGTAFGGMLVRSRSLRMVRKYHVAVSFAGEDRNLADRIASGLRSNNLGVFYDDFESVDLWGKNLYDHLSWVYKDAAEYCVLVISRHYRDKLWTTHERRSAQARAFADASEYILPIRVDDTEIPGVLDTVGFVDARRHSVDEIVRMIVQKLRSHR